MCQVVFNILCNIKKDQFFTTIGILKTICTYLWAEIWTRTDKDVCSLQAKEIVSYRVLRNEQGRDKTQNQDIKDTVVWLHITHVQQKNIKVKVACK
jgi:hypothetical protein